MKPLPSLRTEFSWILFGNLFYAAMQYLLLVSMVKLTNPEAVGEFSFGLAISAPIALFWMLSTRAVLVSDSKDRFEASTYLHLRLLTSVLTILSVLLFVLISRKSGHIAAIILLIAGVKGIESISDLVYGFMQREGVSIKIAKSLSVRGLLSFALGCGLLFTTKKIEALCLGWVIATITTVLFIDLRWLVKSSVLPIGAIRNWSRDISWRTIRMLVIVSFPLGIATILSSLETNIPRYFIEGSMGLGPLGLFAALSYPLILVTQIMGSLATAPAPRLAEYFHHQRYADFKYLLRRLLMIAAGLSFSAAIVCAFGGPWMLNFINGPLYAAQSSAFTILAFATGCNSVAVFFGLALSAMHCFYTKLILQIISLASVAIASAIASAHHSLTAMAYALLAGGLVSLVAQATAFFIEYNRQKVKQA